MITCEYREPRIEIYFREDDPEGKIVLTIQEARDLHKALSKALQNVPCHNPESSMPTGFFEIPKGRSYLIKCD